MASKSQISALPPLANFPTAAWRERLVPEEWEACLDAWILLADAHLSLSNQDFIRISAKDESLTTFLTSFAAESSTASDSHEHQRLKTLRKKSYLLCLRLLDSSQIPQGLLQWDFIADLSKIYGRTNGGKLVGVAWKRHASKLETSFGNLKNSLTKSLDAGLKGDLNTNRSQLKRLNHLLHVSPETAAFFMAGSDYVDSLISCFKLMNPPLRKVIISTTYLSLVGLTEGEKPQYSTLIDQLYSLKSAAEAHKAGPTNANDSLAANLVSQTPLLKQVQQRLPTSDQGRAKSVLASLEGFKIPGVSGKPPERILKRRAEKGKGKARDAGSDCEDGQIHIHRMSLITQVQDLFPDLGSGFIVKLLDEYDENVELVISHLLEGSLPAYLESADRSEQLEVKQPSPTQTVSSLQPRAASYEPSARRNIFDNDELDRLAVDTSRLHFGPRNPDETADDVLQDRSSAPNKAAILSALAAFDSDDDERDDTYDIEDVGGTVDSAAPGNNREEASSGVQDAFDETLFKSYKATPGVFARDRATRQGKARLALKEETGMTDEAIEGWGIMLSRDPGKLRRLEARLSIFQGQQRELGSTSWRDSPAGSGREDSDSDGNRGRGGFRGRGRGGRGRGGNVAGPTGDKETAQARQRKDANKGSRANHNRRDQRAKKMARGGFGVPEAS